MLRYKFAPTVKVVTPGLRDRTPPLKISQLTQDSLDEDSALAEELPFSGSTLPCSHYWSKRRCEVFYKSRRLPYIALTR
jgi:hypothetical protein